MASAADFEYHVCVNKSAKISENHSKETRNSLPVVSSYERNKLRIAGALNFIGDISLLKGEIDEKRPYGIAAGVLYTMGASILALFGSISPQKQLHELRERTAEFIQDRASRSNVKLESSQIIRNKDTSMLTRAGGYIQKNAAAITMWLYSAGAASMLVQGVKQYRDVKEVGSTHDVNDAKATMWYGGFSLFVKLVTSLIPEKMNDEPQKAGEPVSKKGPIAWLKEKPLRIFGYGSLITEGLLGWRAVAKYQNGDMDDFKWSAITTGSYALSDMVIATANKNTANATAVVKQHDQHNLERMVAETIAYQTEGEQAKLVDEAANFLEKQHEIESDGSSLRERITAEVQVFRERHHHSHDDWQSREQVTASEVSAIVQL